MGGNDFTHLMCVLQKIDCSLERIANALEDANAVNEDKASAEVARKKADELTILASWGYAP